MKAFLALLFAALAVTAVLSSPAAKSDDQAWEEYKVKYNKHYETEEEDSRRKELFLNCKREVEEHNKLYEAGESSFAMAVNKFCDWTKEEMKKLNGFRPQANQH